MYGELDPYYVTNGLQAAKHNGGTLYRVGSGKALFQQAYAGNIAWGHLVALEELERHSQVGGQAYFLTDDTPLMNTFTFMEPFLERVGFRLSKGYIPYTLMYAFLRPAEALVHLLEPFCKVQLPAQLCSIIYINRNLYFSRKKAEDLLSYSPLYSPKDAMERSLAFYASNELNKGQGKNATQNLQKDVLQDI